ncbi:hypothetical protein Hanom_Chr04g00337311 [Helianthus anomalus]
MFPLKLMGTTCDLNHSIKLRLNVNHYNSEKQGEVNWRLGQIQNFSTSSLPRFHTQPFQKFFSTAHFSHSDLLSSSFNLFLTLRPDHHR